MENKYYTPSVEDIHVGYEGQYHNVCMDERGKKEFNYDRWDTTILSKINVEIMLKYGINSFRTPYLTREQIEKEGWIKVDNKFNDTQRIFHIPDYELKTEFGSLRLYIPDLDKVYEDIRIEKYTKGNPNDVWSMSSFYIIYRGPCPSINEFRKIVKLLGIVK